VLIFGRDGDVSIFVLPTKLVEPTLKRHRTVLCFAHGEEASVEKAVYYDRRAQSALLSRYGCLKFGQHNKKIFVLPTKLVSK